MSDVKPKVVRHFVEGPPAYPTPIGFATSSFPKELTLQVITDFEYGPPGMTYIELFEPSPYTSRWKDGSLVFEIGLSADPLGDETPGLFEHLRSAMADDSVDALTVHFSIRGALQHMIVEGDGDDAVERLRDECRRVAAECDALLAWRAAVDADSTTPTPQWITALFPPEPPSNMTEGDPAGS